jgi:hypothetical protein
MEGVHVGKKLTHAWAAAELAKARAEMAARVVVNFMVCVVVG